MKRCIELAKCGFGNASPNPMVGSVIVCDGKIIGEGWHRKCGEAHAEVNAVNSVKDKSLLKKSTIYVSLEPCAHVGRTPACADMIIREEIPNIVVGSIDPFEKVAGKGIEKLRAAGRNVKSGILKDECDWQNRRFFTFHTEKRPYIILKWAQTADGFIDNIRTDNSQKPLAITNRHFNTLVHKWRTQEDAILVGTNTVLLDNPNLTNRHWQGRNPVRICIDKKLKLPTSSNIFNSQAKTIIINSQKNSVEGNLHFCQIDFDKNIIPQILEVLYQHEIQSVIIEGGTQTLNSFISQNCWDEARIFTSAQKIANGVKAPEFNFTAQNCETHDGISLKYFYNNKFFKAELH